MLIYHPAFDIHHCIFRLMCLLSKLEKKAYNKERIQILDFYVLFPHLLERMTFPRNAVKFRKHIGQYSSKYENIEDPRRLFWKLTPYQDIALKTLVAYGYIHCDLFQDDKVEFTGAEQPEALVDSIKNTIENNSIVFELLTGPFSNIDLYGSSGLKARTDLFEYRYDPV